MGARFPGLRRVVSAVSSAGCSEVVGVVGAAELARVVRGLDDLRMVFLITLRSSGPSLIPESLLSPFAAGRGFLPEMVLVRPRGAESDSELESELDSSESEEVREDYLNMC